MKAANYLLVLLAVLSAGTLRAQRQVNEADGYKLYARADRPDARYLQGDTIRFVVTFEKDGQPVTGKSLRWNISKDTWSPKTKGTAQVSDGCVVLGGHTLREPGFLQCMVCYTTPEGTELKAMAGAAVEPERIAPSLPEPRDFMAFWKRQLRRQAKIPMNVRITRVDYPEDTTVCMFDIQADCLAGNFSACYAYPKGTKDGSLPALVTLNGAGVKSSRLYWVAHWAKDGLCVLDFNVHGLPNARPEAYYKALEDAELHNYFLFGRDDRNTIFFKDMAMRLIRAIDVITAQPEWDGETLFVQGCSQGGTQAIMAGCLDPRVDLVCAEIPGMCDHTGLLVDRVNGWPKFITTDNDGKPDARRLKAARYYDLVNFARHVRVPTHVTVGLIDSVCPPTTIYAMYNQLPCEKSIHWFLTTGHIQSGEGEDNSRRAIKDYLRRKRE